MKLFAPLVLALTLAACATPSAHRTAEQAMLTAETAFNVAAQAELDAKAAGLLSPAQAAQGDDIRHKAYSALLVARAAYAAGNVPNVGAVTALTEPLLNLAKVPQ